MIWIWKIGFELVWWNSVVNMSKETMNSFLFIILIRCEWPIENRDYLHIAFPALFNVSIFCAYIVVSWMFFFVLFGKLDEERIAGNKSHTHQCSVWTRIKIKFKSRVFGNYYFKNLFIRHMRVLAIQFELKEWFQHAIHRVPICIIFMKLEICGGDLLSICSKHQTITI